MSYTVYKHTSPSDKVYIGITSLKVKERWANGKGYRAQKVFWRAIQKYGWENFKHEILFEDLSEKDAKLKEIELIEFYKSNCNKWKNPAYGYNSTDGGDLREKGFELTEDTKQKISNSKYHTDKKRAVDCFDLKGNFLKSYENLGLASLENGVPRTNIAKCCRYGVKSINGKIYRYHDETNGTNIAPYKTRELKDKKYVSVYDLSGNYIETFSSMLDASIKYKCDSSNISACCKGKTNTCCGFIWFYGIPEKIGYVEPRKDLTKKKKKIAMYDLNNNFIMEFNSIADAKRYIGKPNGNNIHAALAGKRNKAYGYIWKYLGE